MKSANQESERRSTGGRVSGAVVLDCRDAWRSLRGSPGFAAAALILLAFGVGLNTAVFSVINAVLFRPLAVTAPHELVFVWRTDARGNERNLGPYDEVQRLAATADLFTGGAGVEVDRAILRVGLDLEGLTGERVSANYFEVLGVLPSLGRTLASSLDGTPGAERVVVISDALWRRRFNADPAVIGQSIALGTTMFKSESAPRYTIVGVVKPEFMGVSNPWMPTEYWVEYTRRESDVSGILQTRTPRIGMMIARMRPGVTLDQVQAVASTAFPLSDVLVRPAAASSGSGGPIVSGSPPSKLPFGEGAIAPGALGVGLVLVAGLVLAIAAANLSGLVMTRRIARHREVAIRLSLGATRRQIARQLLIETLLLALAGGLIGVAISRVLVMTLLSDMAHGFGGAYARLPSLDVPVDGRVMTFTTLMCVATALGVGLASVRQMRTVNVLTVTASESLGAPTTAGTRRRHWILVPQVALSLAPVLVALVAVRALVKVALVPTGYEPHRAAYVAFERLYDNSYSNMSSAQKSAYLARLAAFPRRLLAAAETVAGIDAAIASSLPIAPRRTNVITQEGLGRPVETAWVTSGYFRVMGIRLLQGRIFDQAEVANGHLVAVVDEQSAHRLWPGQSALGKPLRAPVEIDGSTQRWYEVVGVVGAVRGPLSESEPYAFAYLPWPQAPSTEVILVARGRAVDGLLVPALREVAKHADANIGVLQMGMVTEVIDRRRYSRRLAAQLLAFCAVGGLALTASGLYGVLSYTVAQRRRELGIRAALGAQRRDLMRLVVREGAAVAAVGSVLGIPLALIAVRIASHYVLPIPALDLYTLVIASLAVSVVALAACYFPARRAARVNPIDVLRAL